MCGVDISGFENKPTKGDIIGRRDAELGLLFELLRIVEYKAVNGDLQCISASSKRYLVTKFQELITIQGV